MSALQELARSLDQPEQTLSDLAGLPEDKLRLLAEMVEKAQLDAVQARRDALQQAAPGPLKWILNRFMREAAS